MKSHFNTYCKNNTGVIHFNFFLMIQIKTFVLNFLVKKY